MKYGLESNAIDAIVRCLAAEPKIEEAILYGSRAKSNYRRGSDIDLTLKGETLTLQDVLRLETELDDLLLPYKIDLSIYHQISNPELREHIDRVGVVFYCRRDRTASEKA